MNRVSLIVGKVAAEIAWSELRPDDPEARPALRVTGFTDDEVRALVQAFQELEGERGQSGICLKVGSHTSIEGIPDRFILQQGQTLTFWRNASVPAVLLVDLDVQADEEGLAAVRRLDDTGILSGADSDQIAARQDLVVRHAWQLSGDRQRVPAALSRSLSDVRQSVEGLSLRRWTGFVARVCEAIAAEAVVTPEEVQEYVGRSLPALQLFPDPELFAGKQSASSRLAKNQNVSQCSQPSGAGIPEDDLLHLIDEGTISDATLTKFQTTNDAVRIGMRDYVQRRSPEARESVPLQLWLELFENGAKSTGLGEQVREEVGLKDPNRLDDFDALGVEDELDKNDQEAAEVLIRAEPPSDEAPLVDLLSRRLRRRLEKLAFPDSQMETDPLRALLQALHVLDDESEGTAELLTEGLPDEARWSRWLFALLYGRTLASVAEATADARLQLGFEEDLVRVVRPEFPDPDEEFDPAREWAALRFRMKLSNGSTRRFRWDPLKEPGLIAIGALIDQGAPSPGHPADCELDAFFQSLIDPREWHAIHVAAGTLSGLPGELGELRSLFLRRWAVEGLSTESIEQYIDEWEPLLDRARATLVPNSAPDETLDEVVLDGVVQLSEERLLMLAIHPLRLRWLAGHFKRMEAYLVRALSEGLTLNPENSDLFFEWLDRASPHGTPPLAVGRGEVVGIASREAGYHEEYVPINQRGNERRDWLAAVDDAAIDELAKVVTNYLDNYPYKRDGLSILLLNRDGNTRLPSRLVRQIRSRAGSALRLQFLVLTERAAHNSIVREFEADYGDLEISEDRLLPDVQLVLKDWDPDEPLDLTELHGSLDLALAPAVFGTQTTLSPQTRDASASLGGAYDTWLHAPTFDVQQSEKNVARVMLPHQSDPILEAWSTLCVRQQVFSPVAPNQESNTDYYQLLVRFDRHQKLFSDLHKVAHWVVTLDAFIGRDQIDAMDEKPDVILVRSGVGKNERYTLIVSSSTGETFVVSRLQRKLENDLGFARHPRVGEVASRVYQVGRNVAPSAVLRALGLGRATNEILGLVASRFVVSKRYPIDTSMPGIVVWISFDEQVNWFGGSRHIRADLGRFVCSLDEEGLLHLDILAVESKFRRTYDYGDAEQQLDRTTELLRAAFESADPLPDDHDFWLQELATAVEQTSGHGIPESDLPSRRVIGSAPDNIEELVLQAIRGRRAKLSSVRGVAVVIATDLAAQAPQNSLLGSHDLLRVNRPEFQEVVEGLLSNVDPFQSQKPPGTAAGLSEGTTTSRTSRSTPTASAGREGAPGLGEDELRNRYEILLEVLSEHDVKVDRPEGPWWAEGPGFYILRVVPRRGVTVDKVVNRVNEVALALKLPAESRIRTKLDRGSLVFEIPKQPNERFQVFAEDLWQAVPIDDKALVVPVGADIDGAPITLNFSSPDSPHLLVAGTTGSGKSVALETILRGICRYPADRVHLRLVDPKGTELLSFEDDPHTVGEIAAYSSEAIDILEESVVEMERRYGVMRQVRARSIADYNSQVPEVDRLPWLVIVLDEYADLTSDAQDKSAIEGLLKRLTQKARAAGIHVIAATQRPSADVISSTIRSNLPSQLALRVRTATDSRIIMDESGAETLAGQGDAFLRTARGVTRVQVAIAG